MEHIIFNNVYCSIDESIDKVKRKGDNNMMIEAKIMLLKNRLQKLDSSAKDNQGVCRKIRRELRNLNKKLEINQEGLCSGN